MSLRILPLPYWGYNHFSPDQICLLPASSNQCFHCMLPSQEYWFALLICMLTPSFIPNSTLTLSLPLTIGLICDWQMLTIWFSILCAWYLEHLLLLITANTPAVNVCKSISRQGVASFTHRFFLSSFIWKGVLIFSILICLPINTWWYLHSFLAIRYQKLSDNYLKRSHILLIFWWL